MITGVDAGIMAKTSPCGAAVHFRTIRLHNPNARIRTHPQPIRSLTAVVGRDRRTGPAEAFDSSPPLNGSAVSTLQQQPDQPCHEWKCYPCIQDDYMLVLKTGQSTYGPQRAGNAKQIYHQQYRQDFHGCRAIYPRCQQQNDCEPQCRDTRPESEPVR